MRLVIEGRNSAGARPRFSVVERRTTIPILSNVVLRAGTPSSSSRRPIWSVR